MARSPEKTYVSAYLPKSLKKELVDIAAAERRSVSQVLEFFCEQGVKHHKLPTANPVDQTST